ncbi:DDE_3 domain-containing protein [Trichonephila clavipes]|nr:DDE_3 domain-containing protein [Trichonephila clavipes]
MINGRTRLKVVANGTMTGQRYIDEVVLPHVRLFRGAVGDKFVFMDDNATCHRTLAVQDCLDSEGIQRLVWPVRSPDLNPIDNVWDASGRQVAGRNYPLTNKNTLIRALTEEWDKLPQQLLDNVVQSMCCLKGMLETGGVTGQCVQLWTRNYGALDQTARVCFGVLCANRTREVKRDFVDLRIRRTVRCVGCKCLPFLLVKCAREVPAFRFFPEKDKEEVSSVFTCNVKEARELKERQEARELKERQEIREYELERLRLSNATETVSVSSADLEGQGVNLKDLVPKFDAKNADINLCFEIFERQAIKEKVAEDRWVSQLIPLLPIEIAEIVAKEPLEKSDDYPHIKNLLLARFQLTPIALRDRFESHYADLGPCGRI